MTKQMFFEGLAKHLKIEKYAPIKKSKTRIGSCLTTLAQKYIFDFWTLQENQKLFKGEPEPEKDGESNAEEEEGQAEPEVKGKGVTSFTPRGEFHGMDCVDMVIGMARGDASRIWDYYTRDR